MNVLAGASRERAIEARRERRQVNAILPRPKRTEASSCARVRPAEMR